MPTPLKLRYRRDKVFGEGRCVPIDREAKIRIMVMARALKRRTEPRKHYGKLTDKFVAVLEALLFAFHNAATGRCFPSYKAVADKAACSPSTVGEAIVALEKAGILSWVNRLVRIREWGLDLFGHHAPRWRVVRTSNQYSFVDPKPCIKPPDPSESDFPSRTTAQDLLPCVRLTPQPAATPTFDNYDAALAASRARRGAGGAAKGLPK